jgi:hypothetical protein
MSRRLHIALLALVVLLVAAPSNASAYGGERPADGLLWEEVRVALGYWADRGVEPCPTLNVMIADDLSDPLDAPTPANEMPGEIAGRGGACQLWINSEITRQTRRDLPKPVYRVQSLEDECATVVHEVRHALPGGAEGGVDGAGHTESGVMAADDSQGRVIPGVCSRLARKIDRRITREAKAAKRAKRRARR